MASDEDIRRRVQRLEDREAIRDLMSRYCFIQDRGHKSRAESDLQAFLELCHPDVVWDNSPDGTRAHHGHAAVARYLREIWARFDDCMHFADNVLVTFTSDDRAAGKSSFYATGDLDGESFIASGYYENEYVRAKDGWKFLLHREVPFFFVKTKDDWSGPKPRIMKEWIPSK